MKKTEKIEVRVSVEEKERLGKMAERRGQSVSDMIRERMSEDVSVIPKHIKMNRLISSLALLCAVAALFWLSLSGAKRSGPSAPVMSTIHVFSEDGGATYNLPHLEAYNETYRYFAYGHDFELSVGVEKKDDGLFLLKTQMCKLIQDECIERQENNNILSSPMKHPERVQFQYNGTESKKISVSIKGPRLEELAQEVG